MPATGDSKIQFLTTFWRQSRKRFSPPPRYHKRMWANVAAARRHRGGVDVSNRHPHQATGVHANSNRQPILLAQSAGDCCRCVGNQHRELRCGDSGRRGDYELGTMCNTEPQCACVGLLPRDGQGMRNRVGSRRYISREAEPAGVSELLARLL